MPPVEPEELAESQPIPLPVLVEKLVTGIRAPL
jgi:hypothetical protein